MGLVAESRASLCPPGGWLATADMVLGERLAKESWDGVPVSVLTYCPKRFCKPAREEETKWVGEDDPQVPAPQPSTLWPGEEGMEAEVTSSGLGEWSQGPDIVSLRS